MQHITDSLHLHAFVLFLSSFVLILKPLHAIWVLKDLCTDTVPWRYRWIQPCQCLKLGCKSSVLINILVYIVNATNEDLSYHSKTVCKRIRFVITYIFRVVNKSQEKCEAITELVHPKLYSESVWGLNPTRSHSQLT